MPDVASWLRPADPAAHLAQGLQIGAHIAQANAQLQQQQMLAAQEAEQRKQQLELRKQENDRQMLMEQQKIEIAKSYHQQQLDLQSKRLDEVKKVNDQKVQNAAHLAAARMRMTQRIQGGEDPSKVMMEEGPGAGFTGSALASVARGAQAKLPPTAVQSVPVIGPEGAPLPGVFAYRGPSGQMDVRNSQGFKSPGAIPQANLYWANRYKDQLKDVQATWARRGYSEEPPDNPDSIPKWKALKAQRDGLLAKIAQLVPEPGITATATEAAPKPSGATHRYIPGKGIVEIPPEEPGDTEEE